MAYRAWLLGLVGGTLTLWGGTPAAANPDIVLPRSRATQWLELKTATGDVTYQPAQQTAQPAQLGDRLVDVGDAIQTSADSTAQLAFDREIGSILLRESTVLQVDILETEATGGRITHLAVPQGTARLQVRRFNNPNSRLTVTTPAGIAGVRGTVFGVAVDPTGKTTVATAEGAVVVSGAGETVRLDTDFYSVVQPGEAPSPPQALADTNFDLDLRQLDPLAGPGTTTPSVRLVARVHPINVAFANGMPASVDRDGHLDAVIPLSANRRLTFTLRSPLGDERTYELSVPADGWEALPPQQ